MNGQPEAYGQPARYRVEITVSVAAIEYTPNRTPMEGS